MDTKEKIAVMQAFVDGEKIERRPHYCALQVHDWYAVNQDDLVWDWKNSDYRIAVKPVECWVVVDKEHTAISACPTAAYAAKLVLSFDEGVPSAAPYRAVLMREVA